MKDMSDPVKRIGKKIQVAQKELREYLSQDLDACFMSYDKTLNEFKAVVAQLVDCFGEVSVQDRDMLNKIEKFYQSIFNSLRSFRLQPAGLNNGRLQRVRSKLLTRFSMS